ncbi:hypothetical protein CRYUN_Cryun41cG0036400 [Craigia yunnanensis]
MMESLDHLTVIAESKNSSDNSSLRTIEIKTYLEVSTAPRSSSYINFTILVRFKAAATVAIQNPSRNHASLPQLSLNRRAPVDLVTVLDISDFQSFPSLPRRLFPLGRISDIGRQQALQAVNPLVANVGTNIAEGLRKGAKVMEDRMKKITVASIILLSNRQDTYTVNGDDANKSQPNYQLLVPLSMHGGYNKGFQIPVHAFGLLQCRS